MKVCVFCEKWGSGGIETFLINIFRCLDRKRVEVHLLAAVLESEAYLPQLAEMDLPLTVLPPGPGSSHMRFRAFYEAVRKEEYDAIHFNLYEGLSLGYVWEAKRAGIPVRIAHSHNSFLRRSFLRPVKLALHYGARSLFGSSMTSRAACSRLAAEFLFTRGAVASGDWVFIPNGIRIERFRFDPQGREKMRRELRAERKLLVGCIGRLCYQKNQAFLLRAFALLHQRRPDSQLYLIGEGEDLGMLQRRSKELEISDSVVFYGVTERIPELMWAFDVLAVPSVFEGLGIVAIEAQAAGLPVVCSDKLPTEAVVTDLAEALPTDSASQWAEALLARTRCARRDTSRELQIAGYSIQSTAGAVERLWYGQSNAR